MISNPVIPEFNLGTLIGNLIAVAIIVASLLTFLYLILGGLQWIASGGDKAGLEQAKDRITNALVGLVLVLTAWAIMTLVSNFLGFPFPSISVPRLGGEQAPAAKPPGAPKECEEDKDCRRSGKGKVCHYTKCVASCSAWNNNAPTCHSHGESCSYNTQTNQCIDKY